MQQDILIKGLLFDGQARFLAVSAREMVNDAHHIHDTTATCAAALGRTLMGTSMIAAMEKDENVKVTVRIQGGGPAGNIVCSGNGKGETKGYIVNPHVELAAKADGKLDVGGAVGHDGTITVIRDIGYKEPYTGQAKLISGEIAEDFSAYFAFSQQEPSLVYLGVHVAKDFEISAATGLIIQPMPGHSDDILDKIEAFGPTIYALTERVKNGESLEAVLSDILEEGSPEFLEAMPINYQCDCSQERIEKALIALGEKELCDMIEKDGKAEVKCYFCNKKYHFSADELETLLLKATGKYVEEG